MTHIGWLKFTILAGLTWLFLAACRPATPQPTPTATPTSAPTVAVNRLPEPEAVVCEKRRLSGWGTYVVQTGDSLANLIRGLDVSLRTITRANCLDSANAIAVGDTLFMPHTATPLPTPTPTSTPTPLPTNTSTPFPTATSAPSNPPIPILPLSTPTPGIVSVSNQLASIAGSQAAFAAGQGVNAVVESETTNETEPSIDLPSLVSFGGNGLPNDDEILAKIPDDKRQLLQRQINRKIINSRCQPLGTLPVVDLIHQGEGTKVELGTQVYFYTCEITDTLSLVLTHADGFTESLTTLDNVPHQDFHEVLKDREVIIDWPVMPWYVTGTYTLSITYRDLRQTEQITRADPFSFQVIAPSQSHILIRQPDVFPQGPIVVYYTAFTPTVYHNFGLYVEDDPQPTQRGFIPPQRDMQLQAQWVLRMKNVQPKTGVYWTRQKLYLTSTDPPSGPYGIGSEQELVKIRYPDWFFWLR